MPTKSKMKKNNYVKDTLWYGRNKDGSLAKKPFYGSTVACSLLIHEIGVNLGLDIKGSKSCWWYSKTQIEQILANITYDIEAKTVCQKILENFNKTKTTKEVGTCH